MDDPQAIRPSVLRMLRQLGSTVLAVIRNRLELLAVELQEERSRLFKALILLAVVVVLGVFTLSTAAAALLVLVWKQFGVAGLLIVSALGLVATGIAYWRLRLRLNNWPFLSGTLAELKKDRECLNSKE